MLLGVLNLQSRGRGLSKLVISRVIIRVTPFSALITLLKTYLLSPLPLQVQSWDLGLQAWVSSALNSRILTPKTPCAHIVGT